MKHFKSSTLSLIMATFSNPPLAFVSVPKCYAKLYSSRARGMAIAPDPMPSIVTMNNPDAPIILEQNNYGPSDIRYADFISWYKMIALKKLPSQPMAHRIAALPDDPDLLPQLASHKGIGSKFKWFPTPALHLTTWPDAMEPSSNWPKSWPF
jgi:hypothetical protein